MLPTLPLTTAQQCGTEFPPKGPVATQFQELCGDFAVVQVPYQPAFQMGTFIQEVKTPHKQ